MNQKDKARIFTIVWVTVTLLAIIIGIYFYKRHQPSATMDTAKTQGVQRDARRVTEAASKAEQRQKGIEEAKLRDKRATDATGTKLIQLCLEWAKTAQDQKSSSAIEQQQKYCQQRDNYITQGSLPP